MKTNCLVASVLLLLIASVGPALAAAPKTADLPRGLACEAETQNALARKFRVLALNTKRPGTNLDASIEGPVVPGVSVTAFNGNNGCDNNYDWVFFTDDLVALATGKVKQIAGLMKFSNADSTCGDSACELEETARVSCVLDSRED